MRKTTVEKTFHHNGKKTHFANYLNSTQVTKVQNKKKKSVASLLRTAEKKFPMLKYHKIQPKLKQS